MGKLAPSLNRRVLGAISIGIALTYLGIPTGASSNSTAPYSKSSKSNDAISPELEKDKVDAAINELRNMHLFLPVNGASVSAMKGSFEELRGGVPHHATDIPASRNTEVKAVCDGTIAKLFESKAGGTTIYQFDKKRKFVFYYAHLEKYRTGLTDGVAVKGGEVIGYVGTSGNAPKNCPHLHFEIGLLADPSKWWQSAPLDPYRVFK